MILIYVFVGAIAIVNDLDGNLVLINLKQKIILSYGTYFFARAITIMNDVNYKNWSPCYGWLAFNYVFLVKASSYLRQYMRMVNSKKRKEIDNNI